MPPVPASPPAMPRPRARRPSPAAGLACAALLAACAAGPAAAQTALSTAPGMTAGMRATLDERVSLTFAGSLRDALMTLRAATGLNLVVGVPLGDAAVDAAFSDAPVHEVLDTLLLSRGLGYRPVGDGLVVVSLAELGAGNPLIETAVVPSPAIPPREILPVAEALLSPEGRAHALDAGRSLVVLDYPARVAAVRQQVARLNDAAAARAAAEEAAARAALDLAPGPRGPRFGPGGPVGPGGVAGPLGVRVFELQFVAPEQMAEALVPLLGEGGAVSPLLNEGRMVVTADPARLDAVAKAVAQLDRPREQVRIRALIYDCAVEDSRRLGLNWNGGLRGRSFDADGNALQSLTFAGVTAATGSAAAGAAGGTLAGETLGRYGDLGTTLTALNSSRDSRLLADPNVVALNHERATIKIVTQVPFQQLTQTGLGGAIGTTEFREAGVTLDVVPHIAPDGTITMVVSPEFSVLTGFTPEQNAPIIDTRQATTTVRVRDRETLVLGGLRQRSRTRSGNSLPKLGDAPLIGRLFRSRQFEVRESELLVFLTPEIVGCGHAGDCRETAVARFAGAELEETAVHPVPMGLGPVLAEERAAGCRPWWDRADRPKTVIAPGGGVAAVVGPDGAVYAPACEPGRGPGCDPGAEVLFADPGLIAPSFPDTAAPAPAVPEAFPDAPPAPAAARPPAPALIDPF